MPRRPGAAAQASMTTRAAKVSRPRSTPCRRLAPQHRTKGSWIRTPVRCRWAGTLPRPGRDSTSIARASECDRRHRLPAFLGERVGHSETLQLLAVTGGRNALARPLARRIARGGRLSRAYQVAFGNRLFQSSILGFELIQAPRVFRLKAAEPLASHVERLLADRVPLGHRRHRFASRMITTIWRLHTSLSESGVGLSRNRWSETPGGAPDLVRAQAAKSALTFADAAAP